MSRFAQLQDSSQVVQLLIAFSQECDVGFRQPREQDHTRLTAVVANWILNHYVRVIEYQGQVVGVLIAEKGADFWDPERQILQERAWYVQPHARHTRASARLWSDWQKDSDQYLEKQQVHAVLMSTQGQGTTFDVGQRGWRCIEKTWLKENEWHS